ncbi:hypothetical protein ABT095_08300 [Kitasatospora sp. NPDC002227]|uniref:DUF7878 domain-containing protein n=1 Tax=Kitasatospora sp. NPDC002227 TaxID=3154773 RepID=UPI00332EA712
MQFICRNFGMPDLPRRGLTPQEAPLEVLLIDIEADLSVREQGREVWSEVAFPVAELAYELAHWLRSPGGGQEDFRMKSGVAEDGLIRIVRSDAGWRVGSVLTPDFWTAPVPWDVLVAELGRFDRTVREGVTALGIDPAFIPAVGG